MSLIRFRKFSIELSDKKNKMVRFVPVAIFFALFTGAMYWFGNNVVEEKDGNWVSGTIKTYGERGHTGGKSRSYYTVLKLAGSENEYRLFDNELKYASLPPDSFLLQPGNRISIFSVVPGWQGFGHGGLEILNMKQAGRLMTILNRRNETVRSQNLRSFWIALFICAGVSGITLAYGFYLRKSESAEERR